MMLDMDLLEEFYPKVHKAILDLLLYNDCGDIIGNVLVADEIAQECEPLLGQCDDETIWILVDGEVTEAEQIMIDRPELLPVGMMLSTVWNEYMD